MQSLSVKERARQIVADEEQLILHQLALLNVPEEVAQAADKLIETRQRQRAASLRLAAANDSQASTVRRLRRERGWSQREMAAAAGISPRSAWTADLSPALVRRDTLAKIARALGTTVAALEA